MISATLAQQAQIDGIWHQISPEIVKCIDKTPTYFDAAELWTMCRSGSAFLIVVHDETSILGASIWHFESRNFVCLILVGMKGKMRTAEDWIGAIFEQATTTAKDGGARELRFSGRLSLFHRLKRRVPEMKMIRCTAAVEV